MGRQRGHERRDDGVDVVGGERGLQRRAELLRRRDGREDRRREGEVSFQLRARVGDERGETVGVRDDRDPGPGGQRLGEHIEATSNSCRTLSTRTQPLCAQQGVERLAGSAGLADRVSREAPRTRRVRT